VEKVFVDDPKKAKNEKKPPSYQFDFLSDLIVYIVQKEGRG
jgi:hypothetical protein